MLGTSILRRLDVGRRHDFTRWQQVLIAAVGSVVVLGAAFAVSRSSLFAARDIHVHAGSGGRLSERQVLRVAGLSGHTNVLWLSTGSVASRLEASPWISQATVEKELPSTLRISVRQEEPVLARKTATGYDLLAGNASVVLHAATDRGLPVVSAGSAGQVRDAADALGAMSPWLRDQIDTASVDASGTVSLHLSSTDAAITYGTATDAIPKGVALGGIVRWAESHHVQLGAIDVSAPSAPVARPAGTVAPTPAPCHGKQQSSNNCA
ncbi:MAG: cell division protein FtsQ/DivIB [Actinomycetota bacterium]